jgi:hypothetical protein
MLNDDQCTFVFMKPGASKEVLINDRESIKETVQQALTRYRQLLHDVSSFLRLLFYVSNFLDYREG